MLLCSVLSQPQVQILEHGTSMPTLLPFPKPYWICYLPLLSLTGAILVQLVFARGILLPHGLLFLVSLKYCFSLPVV